MAAARSREPWCNSFRLESDRGVWPYGNGLGRFEYQDRADARVSSRNNNDVARGQSETLVAATVQQVAASNRMKLGSAVGRKSKGRGRSVTATSPDRQPRGAFSPRGLVFIALAPRPRRGTRGFVAGSRCGRARRRLWSREPFRTDPPSAQPPVQGSSFPDRGAPS